MEIPTTSLETDGFATAIPATALVMETAGVKTPSARVSAVPNMHLGADMRTTDDITSNDDSPRRIMATGILGIW